MELAAIKGAQCPMGCGGTLRLDTDGTIVCVGQICDRRDAAHAILSEGTDHVVEVADKRLTIIHPLAERLGRGVFDCDLYELWQASPRVTPGNGVWRAVRTPTGWAFTVDAAPTVEAPTKADPDMPLFDRPELDFSLRKPASS